jgi:hypothetical protein
MKESSKGKSALSGSHKKSKHTHEMHVRRGKSGGFIVKHHHEPDEQGMAEAPEEHVVPDMSALQSHMQENMGDQPPVGGAPAAGPAPVAGAPAAPAPAM